MSKLKAALAAHFFEEYQLITSKNHRNVSSKD